MKRVLLLLLVLATAIAAEPRYIIRVGRQFGFIDRTGKVVVKPQFDRVSDFKEGRAVAWSGSQGGYIDESGAWVVPAQYTTAADFEQGRAVVSKDGKYSVIDPQGKVVAEIPYRVLGGYSAGLAVVQRARSGSTPSAYGYIDRNGKVVIEPQFMPAGQFPEDGGGLAVVGLNKQWCYIDRGGKTVMSLPMEGRDRADPFRDGLLRWKEGFYWGYRDARGGWAIPAKFDDAESFDKGRARVQLKGKWIAIDTKGKELEEKGPQPLKPSSEGLTLARDGDLLGYLKRDGNPAFAFRKYEDAYDYSCGLARIKLDGKFGYLGKDGQLAIPNQYSSAGDFKDCLAYVMTGEGFGYVDPAGKTVWKSEGRF